MRRTRLSLILLAGLTVSGTAVSAAPSPLDDPFFGGEHFSIARDRILHGDRYAFGNTIDVLGRLEGDLVGGAQFVVIDGEVTGDLAVGASTVEIRGTVGDTVRVWAGSLDITGTVEGDVVFFGGMVRVRDGARITGRLLDYGGEARIQGDVGGDVQFGGTKLLLEGIIHGGVDTTAGEVILDGHIGDDTRIKADTIEIREGARLGGDLSYVSRRELHVPDGVVAGEVAYEEQVDDDEEDDGGLTVFGAIWWLWFTGSAMAAGLISVRIGRDFAPFALRAIDNEALVGGLVGFATFLLVPAACFVALLLLPLGLVGFILFLVALYLAKLPVALWIGSRLLRLAGRSDPSPYLAIVLGVLLLYLAFELPYVGLLLKLVTTFLGLGTIVLAARARIQSRQTA